MSAQTGHHPAAIAAAAGGIGALGVSSAVLGAAFAGLTTLVSPRMNRRMTGAPHAVTVTRHLDGTITLDGPQADRPGWWGLEYPGGWAAVGPPDAEGRRELQPVAGARPADGVQAHLHADLVGPDPSCLGLSWREVTVDGPVGPLPTWHVAADPAAGDGADVAVFVHGRGGQRRNGLALVPTLAAAGWDTCLISYRNDEQAPDTGQYLLGGEWEDLAAVVEDLAARGARRIVLIGWSMGSNIVASYLRHRGRRHGTARIAGVVTDAPALSWRDVLVHVAKQRRLPHHLVPLVLALGRWTAGIDWTVLDHVADAAHLHDVPVLVIHGDDDRLVPLSIPTRLAEGLPHAQLEVFEGGGHCRSLNIDPARYRRVLGEFVRACRQDPEPALRVA